MPTKKPRLNITLELIEANVLTGLAKKQNKSIAGFAKELILEALELREDRVLSAIADQRMEEAGKKSHNMVSHEKAWK